MKITSLKARNLQDFQVFFKNPTWFYCAGEPIEREAYGLMREPVRFVDINIPNGFRSVGKLSKIIIKKQI